jgi:Cu/Ag efflux pump CusA
MRSIISSGLRFRFLVLVIAATLVVFGIVQLRTIPVDVLPEFSPPYVEIQTEALGLSAKEVEQLITVPIEQDLLSGVAWVETIRSRSVTGMSSIFLFFEPGTDIYRARQMVAERLTQAHALPHVSKPPTMLQPLSATSRFIIVGLSSKEVSPIQMSVLSRWTVAPRLMGVPGVANVAIWGMRDRQLQVQVDPERLRAHNVSLQQVLETTGNALWVSSLSFLEASTPGTGGFIDTPQQRLGVWHVSPISSAGELSQVSVDGTKLRLGDLARVVEDHQPLIGDAIAGPNPSLLLVIERLPGTHMLQVTRGVETALEQMKPGLGGIEINTTLFRPASYIESALSNISWALLAALILVIAVVVVVLANVRTALITLAVILSSLAVALFVLYQLGATLNMMVLTGLVIALAAVLDDAIADTEHIIQRLRQPRLQSNTESLLNLVADASVEMRSGLLPATLILLLAIVPALFILGVSGSFFQPLALSYAIALLAALAAAFFLTPALCLIFPPARADAKSDAAERGSAMGRAIQTMAGNVLTPVTRTPRIAYITIVGLIIAGLSVVPVLMQQREVLPTFIEPDLLIDLQGAAGTSHPAMVRITNQATKELQAIPGVRNVAAHVGRAVFGDQAVAINSAMLWINVDPAADYNATIANIQETVAGYPGIQQTVQTYLRNKSSAVAESVSANANNLVVRVFGEDLTTLKAQAEVVQQAVGGITGVLDPQLKLPVEEPAFEIQVDLAKAERYGLKPGDVRRSAAILLSGLQVGSLFEDQKVFDVVVWSTPQTRQSLTSIKELLIDAPNGSRVRLQDVADVRIASSPNVIQRESISPYIDVALTARGRSPSAVAADIQSTLSTIPFPLEYHAEVLGSYAQQQDTQLHILIAIAIALLGILLLLQAAFGSWSLAVVSLLALPLSLVGGLLVAALAGSNLSTLGVMAGLLVVFAIAVRHCVMTTCHMQHLQRLGVSFGSVLVLRGTRERVVPMLTTTLATALAFVPFIFFGNRPGLEIVRQMAFVVLGGLVTATLLNLVVVPALYLRFGRITEAAEWMSASIPVVPAAK